MKICKKSESHVNFNSLVMRMLAGCLQLPMIILALLLISPQPAFAETFSVNSAGDESDDNPGDGVCQAGVPGVCTLRAAIAEANDSFEEDTIEIEAGVGPIQAIVNNPFLISQPTIIRGMGAARSIIEPSLNYDDLALIRTGASPVTFENIEIRGHDGGAALWGTRTPLTLINCWVHNNPNSEGLYLDWNQVNNNPNQKFELLIRDSIISSNGRTGLLIIARDNLPSVPRGLIERTTISDNGRRGLELTDLRVFFTRFELEIRNSVVIGNQGGGLDLGFGAVVTIGNSLIANNTTTDEAGGGGIFSGSKTWLINSFVFNNSAVRPAGGGGGGGVRSENVMAIYGSTIASNQADVGGGLDARYASVQVVNSTISDNKATFNGGGIFSQAPVSVECSTIAYNRADSDGNDSGDGGGLFASTESISLHSSILAENTTNRTTGGGVITFPISPDCTQSDTASVVSLNYNMISRTRDCGITRLDGDYFGVGSSHGLLPLDNNGGPTLTHALEAPTFALDGGNPAGCTWDHDLDSDTDPVPVVGDQRGYSRPEDGGIGQALPDMGSFELNGELLNDIYANGFED
jgi:CSLREA domain-containing protein